MAPLLRSYTLRVPPREPIRACLLLPLFLTVSAPIGASERWTSGGPTSSVVIQLVVNPVSSETVYAFAASTHTNPSLHRTTNRARRCTTLPPPAPCARHIHPHHPKRLPAETA